MEMTQAIIQRVQVLMPQNAPMLSLVTKVDIPKGSNTASIPRVNAVSTVQTPTEGDEIVQTSQFDLTETTLTPSIRAIKVRVSERANRFSKQNLMALIAEELAQTQAQNIDELLLAQFTNFHTDNDVGTTNVDLVLAVLRGARRRLKAVTRANGGPAPMPISVVLAPIPEEDLFTNLGTQGVVGATAPWIPNGLSQELLKDYAMPGGRVVSAGLFWDGYMTQDGAADFLCAMFSKKALHYASSKEWATKVYDESSWIGAIIRADADYGVGLGAYTRWGSQITADGA
jgi:hypothetical protein